MLLLQVGHEQSNLLSWEICLGRIWRTR